MGDSHVSLRRQGASERVRIAAPRLLPSQEHKQGILLPSQEHTSGSLLPSQEHGSFTEESVRLSGLMGVLFHWSAEQFWMATPQEVAVLFDAMKDLRGDGTDMSPPDTDTLAALRMRFPDCAGAALS